MLNINVVLGGDFDLSLDGLVMESKADSELPSSKMEMVKKKKGCFCNYVEYNSTCDISAQCLFSWGNCSC
jgi:hypothetical protein